MAERPIDIVRRIYDDGWSRGDFNAGVERYDRYIVLVLREEFPDPGPYWGAQAIRGYMRNHFLADFKDATITGEEFIEAGDSVVVRIRQAAAGAVSDLPVEMSYYNVWTLRGGSIIRIESIMEREDALAAVGRQT
jgi:ketosteroid isomerase-like protein